MELRWTRDGPRWAAPSSVPSSQLPTASSTIPGRPHSLRPAPPPAEQAVLTAPRLCRPLCCALLCSHRSCSRSPGRGSPAKSGLQLLPPASWPQLPAACSFFQCCCPPTAACCRSLQPLCSLRSLSSRAAGAFCLLLPPQLPPCRHLKRCPARRPRWHQGRKRKGLPAASLQPPRKEWKEREQAERTAQRSAARPARTWLHTALFSLTSTRTSLVFICSTAPCSP